MLSLISQPRLAAKPGRQRAVINQSLLCISSLHYPPPPPPPPHCNTGALQSSSATCSLVWPGCCLTNSPTECRDINQSWLTSGLSWSVTDNKIIINSQHIRHHTTPHHRPYLLCSPAGPSLRLNSPISAKNDLVSLYWYKVFISSYTT